MIPIFKGDSYEFWSIKMKTLFKSQDLWDLVEQGFADPDEEGRLKENRKKDAKALFFIQQAVHESVFSRIAAAATSKEAWLTLKKEFQGSSKVIVIKLQTLRREFETLFMHNAESVQDFLSKVTTIVSQMRSFGEQISDQTIVAKVLRSLTPKFDHVVAAIEESKDLSLFSFDDLMGSLQAHEARLNRSHDKGEEKALQVKGESQGQFKKGAGKGKWKNGWHDKGGVHDKGNKTGEKQIDSQNFNEQKNYKNIQCHHCKRYGHKKAFCWRLQKQANYAQEDKEEKLFMAQHDDPNNAVGVWFLDSGCSNHMTGTKSLFRELDETHKLAVRLGDDKAIQVEGKGTIAVETNGGKVKLLHDVLFVPSLSHNLLSVGQLMISGYSILFDCDACIIRDKNSGQVVVNVSMAENRMFPLDISNFNHHALVASKQSESDLWHLRYGHLNVRGLKLLRERQMVHGLPKIESLVFCEGCTYGKQSKLPFPIGKSWRASKTLELVHADLCGPMRTKSHGGSQYFLLFTDDYSRMSWVFFQQLKSETFENFKKFKAYVEKQSGTPIKALRTDRGGEFLSDQFSLFCEENGICRELTAPYTPEQNGVAERKNRTVMEMARSMLKAKGLPNEFWAEGVATAVYLLNLSPTKAVLNQIPYEAWYGFKPWVSHLRVFGCIAYAFIRSESRNKLDEKSIKCIFIGYGTQSKAYKLYDPLNGKVIISRNVVFDEEASWNWNDKQETTTNEIPAEFEAPSEGNNEAPTDTMNSVEQSTPLHSPGGVSSNTSMQSSTSESSSEETPPRKFRSLQEIYASTQALFVAEPTSFEEASGKEEWVKAMKEELNAINKNQTWELVDLPKEKKNYWVEMDI